MQIGRCDRRRREVAARQRANQLDRELERLDGILSEALIWLRFQAEHDRSGEESERRNLLVVPLALAKA